jgi:hypothetical protein
MIPLIVEVLPFLTSLIGSENKILLLDVLDKLFLDLWDYEISSYEKILLE